ncbi:MAG: peptidylprolyl isomerase [Planctomycetota bacterium]
MRTPEIVKTEDATDAVDDSATPPQPTEQASAGPESNAEPVTPVEAMVGQIAGRPIFAHHVLEDLNEQLASLGRRLPPTAFRQQAGTLIREQVGALIQNALVEDEAERNLGERERLWLEGVVASQRESFLRLYGQGSLALAERRIVEVTGQTLQQNLRDIRTRALLSTYFDRNLRPLINVTRRDIERFYRDNDATFNPPTKREIQLIYVSDESAASELVQRLDAGEPFAELAASEANGYAGKATPIALESNDTMFGPNVDPAVMGLAQGEWAGPLPNRGQQWFVFVEKLEQPEQRSLFDAQVDIERALRAQQERELQIELGERLRRDASFTDEGRMTRAVLDIAVARYSTP